MHYVVHLQVSTLDVFVYVVDVVVHFLSDDSAWDVLNQFWKHNSFGRVRVVKKVVAWEKNELVYYCD
jgi:hypothetical protein